MGIEFIYNDGGRAAAGYKGETGDCTVRSIAIASGLSYQEVYDSLNVLAKAEKLGKNKVRSCARTGVSKKIAINYLTSLDAIWTPLMFIGSGCKVHLKTGEVPNKGRFVVSLSGHYAALIDGVLYDTYNCSREGTRCVYGYWEFKSK